MAGIKRKAGVVAVHRSQK